jgi:hypothetical protein
MLTIFDHIAETITELAFMIAVQKESKTLNDKEKGLTKAGYLVTGTLCFVSLLVAFL